MRGVSLLLIGCLLTSCATVTRGRDETITVDSNPPGANATIVCANNVSTSGITPARLTIPRRADLCRVDVEKRGMQTQKVQLERGINGRYWMNFIYAAGVRLVMYKIISAPPAASLLAGLVVKQADQLTDALARLGKKNDNVLENCVEINRLENEADSVARAAIAVLFEKEKDPISLIKLKELYEVLETATDKAEDAANVLEGVVLKSA
jgi:hypothetical protein